MLLKCNCFLINPKENDCYDAAQFIQEIKDWQLTIFVVVLLTVTYSILIIAFAIPSVRPMPYINIDGERQPAENVSYSANKTLKYSKVS